MLMASYSATARASPSAMLRKPSSSVSSLSLTVPDASLSARWKSVSRYSLNSFETPSELDCTSASRPSSQRRHAARDPNCTSSRFRRHSGPCARMSDVCLCAGALGSVSEISARSSTRMWSFHDQRSVERSTESCRKAARRSALASDARTPPLRPSTWSTAVAVFCLISAPRRPRRLPPLASPRASCPRIPFGLAAASESPSTSRSLTLQPRSIEWRQRAIRPFLDGVASGSLTPLGSSSVLCGLIWLRRKFLRPRPKLRVATMST